MAFWLGAAYFDLRRTSVHEERLRRMLAQAPVLAQVEGGLRADGSPLVASPAGDSQLRSWAARWPSPLGQQLLAKGRLHSQVRIFRAHDTHYAIFFDEHGVMRDYLCLPQVPR